MPSAISAVQARISAIESRFAPPVRHETSPGSTTGPNPINFDAALEAASAELSATLSPEITETSDPSHDGTVIHTMGPAGAPPELVAYGNGRIPASELVEIGKGSHKMWAPAAEAFKAMAAAAAEDGIFIDVSDSYRSYDAQVDLAERKGLYSQGGWAATPGTSNHGWGRALDIDTSGGTLEWLRAHGAEYGFFEDVPREPWHWTYRPA